MSDIHVFGADWCHDTHHTLNHLKRLGIPFDYADVDDDPAARQWVLEQNDGKQKTPTVDIKGTVLSVPSNEDLDTVLQQHNLLQ
jgi:mycoredoxin